MTLWKSASYVFFASGVLLLETPGFAPQRAMFPDVPPHHWAYESVKALKEGAFVLPQAQTQASYLPKKFTLYIGGFAGPTYRVEWNGTTLVYRYFYTGGAKEPQETHTFAPSEQEWKRFWNEIDGLRLWQWREMYYDPNTRDGTSWSIDIEQGGKSGRKKRSNGTNSYPSDKDITKETRFRIGQNPDPSKVFQKYLKAVETLLGGKTFR
jgi:hypothetical protein